MVIIFRAILVFLLVFQGGFFPSAFLLIGIGGVPCLILSKRNVRFTKEIAGLSVLVIAYLFSAIVNGVSYSGLNYGMLPLVCLIVAMLFNTLDIKEKNDIISHVEIIGIVSAIFAILSFMGIFHIPGGINVGRLQFTFQYANVAGTWFAVSYTLGRDSVKKSVRWLSILNLVALIMTKSIGAIFICFMLQCVWIIRMTISNYGKKVWFGWITFLFVCIGGLFVVVTRFSQGIYTMIERVIHSYDGIRLMKSNVLWGIGADNWQYVYPFHQSAQYKAGEIHNSYVQMGVDAGIIPMVIMMGLLIATVARFIREKDCRIEATLFILLHSMLDYCLSFVFIDVLLIVLLGTVNKDNDNKKWSDIQKKICFKKISTFKIESKTEMTIRNYRVVKIVGCVLIFLQLCFGYYGTMQIRNMEKSAIIGNADKVVKTYEENYQLMKDGYKENELYLRALIMQGENNKAIQIAEGLRNKSAQANYYELLARKYMGNLEMKYVIEMAEAQPFNYEVLCELANIVKQGNYTDSENKEFFSILRKINETLQAFPTCLLDNQKEFQLNTDR